MQARIFLSMWLPGKKMSEKQRKSGYQVEYGEQWKPEKNLCVVLDPADCYYRYFGCHFMMIVGQESK
jgi:hypothetical protein